jgi:hypothetical protein
MVLWELHTGGPSLEVIGKPGVRLGKHMSRYPPPISKTHNTITSLLIYIYNNNNNIIIIIYIYIGPSLWCYGFLENRGSRECGLQVLQTPGVTLLLRIWSHAKKTRQRPGNATTPRCCLLGILLNCRWLCGPPAHWAAHPNGRGINPSP